jgi:nicotinamidase-related amidase
MRVLVVVDVQKDFVDGALGSIAAQSIIPHMRKRIKDYADGETLILFTKDTHEENYLETFEGVRLPVEHCVRGTPGWSLVKDISTLADGYSNFLIFSGEEVIRSRILKNTFGSIKLCEILKQYENEITDITFMGFCTDICVISNVLMARAYLPNTRIIVDASCCAGTTLDKHLAALEVMKSCQIDVIN